MTQMISVQIRFPPEELKKIDTYVKRGEYSSRADFIRDAVSKAEILNSLQKLREIVKDEGITEKELLEGGKEVRKRLFEEMFGDS